MIKEIRIKSNLLLKVLSHESGSLVIGVVGVVNHLNSYNFQCELVKLIQTDLKIALDCAELSYISSSGIGAFIFVKKKLKDIGGDLLLINIGQKVQSIINSMGVKDFIRC